MAGTSASGSDAVLRTAMPGHDKGFQSLGASRLAMRRPAVDETAVTNIPPSHVHDDHQVQCLSIDRDVSSNIP
jgi:hypothetical protein